MYICNICASDERRLAKLQNHFVSVAEHIHSKHDNFELQCDVKWMVTS